MRKRKIYIIIFLVVVVFTALVGVRVKQRNEEKLLLKEKKPPVTAVSVILPKQGKIAETFSTTGMLVSKNEVQVTPKVSGRLNSLTVDEGSFVSAGQVIGEIDHSELDAQIMQAQAQLKVANANLSLQLAGPQDMQVVQSEASVRQAEASLGQAQANLGQLRVSLARAQTDLIRNQALQTQGAIPMNQVETSQSQVDTLQKQIIAAQQQVRAVQQQVVSARAASQLVKEGTRKEQIASVRATTEQANAGINILRAQLANYRVTSPLSGVVTKRNLDAGSLAGPSTPIITVSQNARPDLEMNIPEKQILNVKVGQQVNIESSSFPDKNMAVTITKISPVVDLQTRLVKVTGAVNSPLPLKIGMSFDCKIVLNQKNNSMILPSEAIIQQENIRLVYLSVNNKVVARKVTTGIQTPTEIEVKSGLKPDDQVIYKGNTFVKPGDKIQIEKDLTTI
jgi:HlyD family secretion protein